MTKAVCQFTTYKTSSQLSVTERYHRFFCQKYGYSYHLHRGHFDSNYHPYWQKPRYLRSIVEKGYTDLVWLDADAFWLGRRSLDIPFLPGTVLGIHKHKSYNAGVLFLKGTQESLLDFIDLWITTDDGGSVLRDNAALITLINSGMKITDIPREFNSQRTRSHCPPCEKWDYLSLDPVIECWHGVVNREKKMQTYVDDRFAGTLPYLLANIQNRNQLPQLARVINAKTIVEVGVFKGDFTVHLAQCLPECNIYGIDLWEPFGNDPLSNKQILQQAKRKAKGSEKSLRNMFLLEQESNVSFNIPIPDLVYIDANHSYEAVKRNLETWWNRLRPGGVLCGHDYTGPQPWIQGVKKAVDEFAQSLGLQVFITQEGNASWILVKSEPYFIAT